MAFLNLTEALKHGNWRECGKFWSSSENELHHMRAYTLWFWQMTLPYCRFNPSTGNGSASLVLCSNAVPKTPRHNVVLHIGRKLIYRKIWCGKGGDRSTFITSALEPSPQQPGCSVQKMFAYAFHRRSTFQSHSQTNVHYSPFPPFPFIPPRFYHTPTHWGWLTIPSQPTKPAYWGCGKKTRAFRGNPHGHRQHIETPQKQHCRVKIKSRSLQPETAPLSAPLCCT